MTALRLCLTWLRGTFALSTSARAWRERAAVAGLAAAALGLWLLGTHLGNHEIVLSKFGARLANLTLFLITGLPILTILQFLGGIDPDLVLVGFAATGLTMFGLGGVALFLSVVSQKPRDAIALTYLI